MKTFKLFIYLFFIASAICPAFGQTSRVEASVSKTDTSKKKKGFLGGIFGKKNREKEQLEVENAKLKEETKREKEEIWELSKKHEQKTIEVQEIGLQHSITESQKKQLNSELKLAKTLIQGLSLEQAKTQLALTQQKAKYDSVSYIVTLDSVQAAQQQAVLLQKEAEVELHSSQRNLMIAVLGIVLLLAAGQFFRYNQVKRHALELKIKNEIIEKEKQRSDELLLNILPYSIANELKINGKVHAQHYDQVSVLFTDFINFTGITELLSPAELVAELDYCFKNFDSIIAKYGLEKIKTIGDAYMCAGGLPTPKSDHLSDIINASIEIRAFLFDWNTLRAAQNLPQFNARIGIHTGPIVAGVVGIKKFVYDIWGDAVNIASRIETAGEANMINVSEDTYQLIKDKFNCISRGKIFSKNKGEIGMYFVEGVKA